MSKHGGPFPTKQADFNTYIKRAIPYLQANDARLNVSGPNVNELVGLLNDWNLLFPKSQAQPSAPKLLPKYELASPNYDLITYVGPKN